MRLSLRARLFVLVLAINVGVFVLGGYFLLRRIDERTPENTDRFADAVVYTVSSMIRPGEDVNAARILAWPSWNAIDDALLVSNQLDELPSGRLQPRGVALNPVGSGRRAAAFDTDAVLRAIASAMRNGVPIDGVESGRVVPIRVSDAAGAAEAIWGGCWYRVRHESGLGPIARDLLPWFLISTLLLTGGTFLMLRGLVLEPVEELASAARRIEQGDLSVRVGSASRGAELGDLSRAFNAMVGRLEGYNQRLAAEVQHQTEQARRAEAAAMTQRRLAAMGELAAGIAHEINNPLGGLINAAETLRRADLAPAKRAQYLDLLKDGLERIRSTVSQLLRFTPREAAPTSLLVSSIARDALDLVRHRAERSGVECVLDVDPDEPHVLGLRNELGQALLNLYVNALDALDALEVGGRADGVAASVRGARAKRIEIALRRVGRELCVSVSDNGPGMRAELLPKAADLFFTTKEVGKGTGLGLSIVHGIAEQHGGRLVLHSEPGAGFRAEIRLPLAEARA